MTLETQPQALRESHQFNVMHFGAKGDGQTDDTAAIQRALDAAATVRGTVYIPDGTFLSSTLRLPAHTGLVGHATFGWGPQSFGGSILKLIDPDVPCFIDLTGAVGATLHGLNIFGDSLGSEVHGIYTGEYPEKTEEDAPRIERCHISSFTGDGIHLMPIWCFSIRGCEITSNRGHGLHVHGSDGFILDNWLSGNWKSGYCADGLNSALTITGNRFEWNREGGLRILGGSFYNITGNFIDRSGGPGIALLPRSGNASFCVTMTGNIIFRSGKPEWTTGAYDSAHVRIEDAHGIVFSGNSLCVGQDDGNAGDMSPQYGLVLRALQHSVIERNTLHIGALKELIIDLGEHGDGVMIEGNVGNLLTDTAVSIWATR